MSYFDDEELDEAVEEDDVEMGELDIDRDGHVVERRRRGKHTPEDEGFGDDFGKDLGDESDE